MAKTFDYQAARESGYNEEEILSFLQEHHPKFDTQAALESGYSPEEVNQFLSSHKPKRSPLEKAGRTALQLGIGAAESALLPYEISTIPVASKQAQLAPYREALGDELEDLMIRKSSGQWSPQDEEFLQHIQDQIKDPEKAMEFVQTADIGVRSLTEKATGLDLHPEGIIEKAAAWSGFLKNPLKMKELAKVGLNPKSILKTILPSGSETARGIGAGIGLEMAEEGDFGPLGTMVAAVVGDLIGGGALGATKAVLTPRKTLGKVFSKFTPKEKIDLQKSIIEDFKEAGIQADIGTITGSDLMKAAQARLASSALTGEELNEFKKTTFDQIKSNYKKLADELGKNRFETMFEASETGKEYLSSIRDAEKERIGNMYEKARSRIEQVGESASVNPSGLASTINRLEKTLTPGSVKSTEQKAVLDILERVKGDILDPEGKIKLANVVDLINDKIALNDIINYEVQGGQKQLLRNIVNAIDDTIQSYGSKDKQFLKNYNQANKEFAEYAKTFRGPSVNKVLISSDPEVLMNKMNTVQGMRDLEKAFSKSANGKKVFNDLKRFKLDRLVEDKLIDNTTQQIKMGTFSNLLKNPKQMELIKEIVGPSSFRELVKLQKVVNHLHESASKFYNASKSGTTVIDAGIVAKAVNDIGHILSGNPWPLMRTGATVFGGKYITRLMGDPEFLKTVEEFVKASRKDDLKGLFKIAERLVEPIRAAIVESKGEKFLERNDKIKSPQQQNLKNQFGVKEDSVVMLDPEGNPLRVPLDEIDRYESLGATFP